MGNVTTKSKNKDKNAVKTTKTSEDKEYSGFLKDLDTSKLKHELNDDIRLYYDISDKILGMYEESIKYLVLLLTNLK